MDSKHMNRSELDQFSANILINLGLINVAALAAVLSFDNLAKFPTTPYAVGLISSLLSQLLWYADSAFSHAFGDTVDEVNGKIGVVVTIAIIVLGIISASCIVYGCLKLIGFSDCLSFLVSVLLCFIPLILLIFAARREEKARRG